MKRGVWVEVIEPTQFSNGNVITLCDGGQCFAFTDSHHPRAMYFATVLMLLLAYWHLNLLHEGDFEVGSGEPLTQPGMMRHVVVGGKTIGQGGGLSNGYRLNNDAVPSVALIVVHRPQFAKAVGICGRIGINLFVFMIL